MRYLPLFFLLFVLQSCSRECTTEIYCGGSWRYAPEFHNYSLDDLDSVIVKQYPPDGKFSNAESERIYLIGDTTTGYAGDPRYQRKLSALDKLAPNDSFATRGYHFIEEIPATNTAYDIEVIIPSKQKTHRISNIKFVGAYSTIIEHFCNQPASGGCIRSLVSYNIDGVEVNSSRIILAN
jgi:hypothetical protein